MLIFFSLPYAGFSFVLLAYIFTEQIHCAIKLNLHLIQIKNMKQKAQFCRPSCFRLIDEFLNVCCKKNNIL